MESMRQSRDGFSSLYLGGDSYHPDTLLLLFYSTGIVAFECEVRHISDGELGFQMVLKQVLYNHEGSTEVYIATL